MKSPTACATRKSLSSIAPVCECSGSSYLETDCFLRFDAKTAYDFVYDSDDYSKSVADKYRTRSDIRESLSTDKLWQPQCQKRVNKS